MPPGVANATLYWNIESFLWDKALYFWMSIISPKSMRGRIND